MKNEKGTPEGAPIPNESTNKDSKRYVIYNALYYFFIFGTTILLILHEYGKL